VYQLGPGAAASPVILHVPHASRAIPPTVRARILLDDEALAAELDRMTDAHTDLLADRAAGAAAVRPWQFVNRLSRLVVDPERFPDEREELTAVGMGAVYTRTSHGGRLREEDPAHAEELLGAYFRPYAEAMTALVDARLAATGRAVILDVHSYPRDTLPYELHGGPRPAVCLGTDAAHSPPHLVEAAREALAGCGDIALDTPFAGCYVPLAHYRRNPAVTGLMIELRRDVVAAHADRLVAALAALVDRAA
jgi:N-formylglutamate amidohydrolase